MSILPPECKDLSKEIQAQLENLYQSCLSPTHWLEGKGNQNKATQSLKHYLKRLQYFGVYETDEIQWVTDLESAKVAHQASLRSTALDESRELALQSIQDTASLYGRAAALQAVRQDIRAKILEQSHLFFTNHDCANAADDAALAASWKVVSDVQLEPSPFDPLMQIWFEGFWPIGPLAGKFVIYAPTEEEQRLRQQKHAEATSASSEMASSPQPSASSPSPQPESHSPVAPNTNAAEAPVTTPPPASSVSEPSVQTTSSKQGHSSQPPDDLLASAQAQIAQITSKIQLNLPTGLDPNRQTLEFSSNMAEDISSLISSRTTTANNSPSALDAAAPLSVPSVVSQPSADLVVMNPETHAIQTIAPIPTVNTPSFPPPTSPPIPTGVAVPASGVSSSPAVPPPSAVPPSVAIQPPVAIQSPPNGYGNGYGHAQPTPLTPASSVSVHHPVSLPPSAPPVYNMPMQPPVSVTPQVPTLSPGSVPTNMPVMSYPPSHSSVPGIPMAQGNTLAPMPPPPMVLGTSPANMYPVGAMFPPSSEGFVQHHTPATGAQPAYSVPSSPGYPSQPGVPPTGMLPPTAMRPPMAPRAATAPRQSLQNDPLDQDALAHAAEFPKRSSHLGLWLFLLTLLGLGGAGGWYVYNNSSGVLFAKATSLLQEQQWREAEPWLQRIQKQDPNYPGLDRALGHVYFATQRDQEALLAYTRAMPKHPKDGLIQRNLGYLYLKKREWQEALRLLEQASLTLSTDAYVWIYMGAAQIQLQRYSFASQTLRKATALAPQNAAAWNDLGSALLQEAYLIGNNAPPPPSPPPTDRVQQLAQEAETAFRKATQLEANTALYHRNLGDALALQQKSEAANQSYLTAIQQDASQAASFNNRAALLLQQNRIDDALPLLSRAVSLLKQEYQTSTSPEVRQQLASTYFNLAAAYESNKQKDEALQAYRQATMLNPEDADGFCRMGRLLHAAHKNKDALRAYQSCLRLDPGNHHAKRMVQRLDR